MIKIKLSEICDLQNGYAFKSSDYVEVSNTLSCRMSNIRLGGIFDIQYNARYLPDDFADKFKSFLLQDGDLVIAMTDLANDPKLLGVPTLVKTECKKILLNQRVGRILIKDSTKVDNKYLQYVLNDPDTRDFYKKFASGGLQINLGKTDLLNVEIPLPPLPEQRRIAAILDKADELRQKRRQAIEKLDQLLQATFIDMFGDPVSNPKGWEVIKVREIISDFVGGKNLECPEESDSPYRILKVSAVTSKNYKYFESKAAPTGFSPAQEAIVRKGDLLFSRANTTELVAATAYVWETPENIVLPDKLWKFIIKETNSVNTLYLWELFKNAAFRCELSKLSSGTSGSMKNISKSKLKEMTMIYPPKDIQDHYGRISLKVWQEIESVKAHQSNLELLFASLQQRAFSGNL